MTSDNDELEYDLSAFEAPEPPEGIADAVVARLGGTSVTLAVPGETRDSKRRGVVVAAVAVACLAAAAGTYALVQGSRRAGPSRGDVVAARARTLSLDGVDADLDPGAQVRWQRRGSLLDVEQREGSAAWRVDGDTTLRIDAGAMVASVEATGASLRVEVSMNATDARVLGASALTAAAVSMVTVTVYTGNVKVSERGQTVIVQPGETRSVIPPQPAPPSPEPVVAGAPITDDATAEPTICDEVSCVLNNYAGACCAQFKAGTPPAVVDTLDRAAISRTIQWIMPRIRACRTQAAGGGTIVMSVSVNPDGTVAKASATKTFSQPVADCVADILRTAKFRAAKQTTSFSYPFSFAGEASPTTTSTVATGATGLTRADISKAIGLAKSTIRACGAKSAASGTVKVNVKVRPDGKVGAVSTNQTYDAKVSGCVLDVVKKLTFPVTDDGGSFSYPFVFEAAATAPPANCDADALKDAGMEKLNMGQHAAALAQFEASLRCKPDDGYVVQLAFMTACGSKNTAKARRYYARLSPAQQTKFNQICIRNGIDATSPGSSASQPGIGFLEVRSRPAAKVFVDGVDTGMTTPISGSALELQAGKHKVTLVVGEDRFTYPVNIVDGGALVLDKILE